MTARELERILDRPVARVRSRAFAYASSHPLSRLTVEFADGETAELVAKDTRELLPAARAAKPAFLRDPERELEVYREVLPGSGVGAPRLAGASGFTLLVEHVPGAPLTEVGELASWRRAVAETARMHRRLARRATPHLLRLDPFYWARWFDRARVNAGSALDSLASPFRAAVERILELPTAVVHGELYPANVLVAGERVCSVDWETAGVGPALLDLAALTSGRGWTAEERRQLVAAYAEESGSPAAELEPDLERCRLLLAVQWLGWSTAWSPPASQRQNWLADARRAAEAIG